MALAPNPARRRDPSYEPLTNGTEFDPHDAESYSDEELLELLDAYYKEMRRQYQQSSNTVAPHTEAKPTPVGQGESTATPLMAGSNPGGVGISQPTGL